jgi:hypothetical protein
MRLYLIMENIKAAMLRPNNIEKVAVIYTMPN